MGKRGPKPKQKVKIKWSADFAYAIGLITTDGNLSSSGRHMSLVSKDLEQINNFLKCLKISVKIGRTSSGHDKGMAYRVQFGDVLFYQHLQSLGLSPAKSKILGPLKIPNKYFFDFLRGVFDGDGSTYAYWDKRWKSSYMFYLVFASASKSFIDWLRTRIENFTRNRGHITKDNRGSTLQLKYAKKEGLRIIKRMYRQKNSVHLTRKYLKIQKMLAIVEEAV